MKLSTRSKPMPFPASLLGVSRVMVMWQEATVKSWLTVMEQMDLNIKDINCKNGIWVHVWRCRRASGIETESWLKYFPNPLMSYTFRINCNAMLLLYMDEFEKFVNRTWIAELLANSARILSGKLKRSEPMEKSLRGESLKVQFAPSFRLSDGSP